MCLQDTTSMLLESAGGTMNWVSYDLEKTFDPSEFSVEVINEERIEVVFPNKGLPKYSQNVENLKLDSVEKYLRSHFNEALMIDLERIQKEGTRDIAIDGDIQRITTTNYDILQFAFQSTHSPLEFAEIFSRIPNS